MIFTAPCWYGTSGSSLFPRVHLLLLPGKKHTNASFLLLKLNDCRKLFSYSYLFSCFTRSAQNVKDNSLTSAASPPSWLSYSSSASCMYSYFATVPLFGKRHFLICIVYLIFSDIHLQISSTNTLLIFNTCLMTDKY